MTRITANSDGDTCKFALFTFMLCFCFDGNAVTVCVYDFVFTFAQKCLLYIYFLLNLEALTLVLCEKVFKTLYFLVLQDA